MNRKPSTAQTQLADALELTSIRIEKFNRKKAIAIFANGKGYKIAKFATHLGEKLSVNAIQFPALFSALHNHDELLDIVGAFADEIGVNANGESAGRAAQLDGLRLNVDAETAKFFVTNFKERLAKMCGETYLKIKGLTIAEAYDEARVVYARYYPTGPRGVSKAIIDGYEREAYNQYCTPAWRDYTGPKDLPDELPDLFLKLVQHLIPSELEREYLYAWLYASLFERAPVYLILCGPPGTGKNRLKLVFRALHGFDNTVDGKKSSLDEKFNATLTGCTLTWFDELDYDAKMENRMKELPNDTVAIEKKGVDATRGTKIYSSFVISNNKPRDNYIAMDARKFVPLQITKKRLEESMSSDEIDELTRKLDDEESEHFDLEFVAQIAHWIQKNGRSGKWPNLEYRGPMFYELVRTSMSSIQRRIIRYVADLRPESFDRKIVYHPDSGWLWSTISEVMARKNGSKAAPMPEFSNAHHLFDMYVDSTGERVFETTLIPGDIMGDFFVKPIKKLVIYDGENVQSDDCNEFQKSVTKRDVIAEQNDLDNL